MHSPKTLGVFWLSMEDVTYLHSGFTHLLHCHFLPLEHFYK